MAVFDEKYLITDISGKYYKVAETEIEGGPQTLEEIQVLELTADIFYEYGLDVMPGAELLTQLESPGFLFWQDSAEADLPSFRILVEALPFSQMVYTGDIDMRDETILGIEKAEIDCDENMLFGVSVDGGDTWYAYANNQWAILSEEKSGMSAAAMENIPTDAWALLMTTGHYKFRFLLREGGYLNSLVIHYLN